MAKQSNDKLKQVTTPTGVASYPFLTRPSTKFDPDGEYKVTLILPVTEAQGVIELIDEAMQESFIKAKTENPKKAKTLRMANPPYADVVDDDGNETGEVKLTFKSKSKITPRNGGEPFEIRPALFDAAGQALGKVSIGSGSRIKVCAELVPFFTDLVGAGISLRLKAVQVIELVEYNGASAARYGFEEEAGFTQSHNDEPVDDDGDF